MRKTEIIKTARSFSSAEGIKANAIVGAPQIAGLEKINGFYRSFSDKTIAFAESSAKKGKLNPVNIRVLPLVRYSGEKRTDITLDIIISGGGKLLMYKRIAQRWDTEKERLLPPDKHGCETFSDGENIFVIKNLFGKITPRRLGDYIGEEKINVREKSGNKRKRVNK